MLQLIKQRKRFDCGVACIAMFTGRSYDDVYNAHFKGRDFDAQNMNNGDFIFALNFILLGDGKRRLLEKKANKLKFSKPAVLIVPSLNFPGTLHSIVWNPADDYSEDNFKGQVLDSQVGDKVYNLERLQKLIQLKGVFSGFQ